MRSGLLAARTPIGLFSDADLSTPLEETPKLIEPIANGEVDIAFGSRALDRTLIGVHQPWRREQAGRIFNLLVRTATGLPFWDTQCGFKAFRLEACRPILEAAQIEGFAFDVELLYFAHRAGLRIREVPVRWNHAEGSKVSFFRDSLRMLREVIGLRASRSFQLERVVPNALTNAALPPDFRCIALGTRYWPSAISIVSETPLHRSPYLFFLLGHLN